MDCAKAQDEILDALDEVRSGAIQREVEMHLSTCVRCSAFAARQRALDAQLTSALKAPEFSPPFRTILRSRIQQERVGSTLDALPDVVHLTSCGAATLVCAALMPFDPTLSVGAGATLTLLSYALLTLVRGSFEDIEQVD